MEAARQCKRLPLLMLLLVLVQSISVLAAFTNNFVAYPTNAQPCLYDAAIGSNCDGTNITAMNMCLCENGGNFVISAATCIGTSDRSDLETVYSVMADACAFSDTPLSVSQKDFMAAGQGLLSSSSSTSTTSSSHGTATDSATTATSASSGHPVTQTSTGSTATNTGASDSDDGPAGMSSTATIGIISGAAVAGVAIIAVLIFFIIRMRRKKQPGEEQRPMLGMPAFSAGSGGTELSHYTGPALSQYTGTAGSTYDYKMHDGFGDSKWMQTSIDSYPTTPSSVFHPGRMQSPQPPQNVVFELSAEPPPIVIAEMPSTPVESANYPHNPQTPQSHQQ